MRERVNPRINRDLPQQVTPPDNRSEDTNRTLSLVDVTTSVGWEDVVVENLRRRCRSIERFLAISRHLTPAEIARYQSHHELMELIVGDPKAFFNTDPLEGTV